MEPLSQTMPESIVPGVNDPCTIRRKRRRRQAAIPRELRTEVTQCAKSLARKYAHLFAGDRKLKDRIMRLVRALLPPRPRRRGRPANTDVTRAIRLLRKFHRDYPEEVPRQHWARVYPLVIPNFHSMTDPEQDTSRFALRERVRWRLRKRRGKNRAEFSVFYFSRPRFARHFLR